MFIPRRSIHPARICQAKKVRPPVKTNTPRRKTPPPPKKAPPQPNMGLALGWDGLPRSSNWIPHWSKPNTTGKPSIYDSSLRTLLQTNPTPGEMSKAVEAHRLSDAPPLTNHQYRALIVEHSMQKRDRETGWIVEDLRPTKGKGIEPRRLISLAFGAVYRGDMDVAEEVAAWMPVHNHTWIFRYLMAKGWSQAGYVVHAKHWEGLAAATTSKSMHVGPFQFNKVKVALLRQLFNTTTSFDAPFHKRQSLSINPEAIPHLVHMEEEWESIRQRDYIGIGESGWDLRLRIGLWAEGGEGVMKVMREMEEPRAKESATRMNIASFFAWRWTGDRALELLVKEGEMVLAQEVHALLERWESTDRYEGDKEIEIHSRAWIRRQWLLIGYIGVGDTAMIDVLVKEMRKEGWKGNDKFWAQVLAWRIEIYGVVSAHNLLRQLMKGDGLWGIETDGVKYVRGRAIREVAWGYLEEKNLDAITRLILEWEKSATLLSAPGRMALWTILIVGHTSFNRGKFPSWMIGDRPEEELFDHSVYRSVFPIPLRQLIFYLRYPVKSVFLGVKLKEALSRLAQKLE